MNEILKPRGQLSGIEVVVSQIQDLKRLKAVETTFIVDSAINRFVVEIEANYIASTVASYAAPVTAICGLIPLY